MKTKFLNRYVAILAAGITVLSACSKDEENSIKPSDEPALEEVSLSLAGDATSEIIEIPEGLASSSDSIAQVAISSIQTVNQITNYFSVFTPPANAEKSNSPIISANGRAKATNKEYLVYTWVIGQHSIAYQLSSEGDKYVWEIFMKNGDEDYKKYVYTEESKTVKKGFMKVYDISGFIAEDGVLAEYTWDKNSDGVFFVTASLPFAELAYHITLNADHSGNVKYYLGGEIYYHIIWTGQGSGNWMWYSEGEVVSEGVWNV